MGFFLSITLVMNFLFFRDFGVSDPESSFHLLPHLTWPVFFLSKLSVSSWWVFNNAALLVLAVFAAVLFFFRSRWAYPFFALAFAFKLLIYFSDYRFMGNYHLMQNWLILLFLVSSRPFESYRVLICLFYFFAGTIKLNTEWLSGAGLSHVPWPWPQEIKTILLFSVIVLELGLIWGLCSRRRLWTALTLALLFCFHFVSVYFVQMYSPTIMLLLLAPVVVGLFDQGRSGWDRPRLNPPWDFRGWTVIAVFSFLQLVPFWSPGDTALTGEGRLGALNMMDLQPQCQAVLHLRKGSTLHEIDLGKNGRVARARCDPAFFMAQIQDFCRESSGPATFALITQKASQSSRKPLFWSKDICADAQKYSFFGRNSLILQGEAEFPTFSGAATSQEPPTDQPKDQQRDQPTFFRGDAQNTGRFGTISAAAPKQLTRVLDESLNIGIHSAVKSTPVTDGQNFFVAGDSGQLLALNPQGQIRWRFLADTNFGIHSTPVLSKGALFVGTYGGRLYKFQKDTGELLWWKQLGTAIGASPVLLGERLYVNVEERAPVGGFLICLDAHSGEVLWKSENFGENSHSTPAVSADGRSLIFGDNAGLVRSLSISTGKTNWTRDLGQEIKLAITVIEDRAYVLSWNYSLTELRLKDGVVTNSLHLPDRVMSSPTWIYGTNEIFFSLMNGTLIWFDFKNWKITKEWALGEPGGKASGVAYKTGQGRSRLLVGCRGQLICLFDDRKALLATEPVGGRIANSVALASVGLMATTENTGQIFLMNLPPD